MAKVVVITGASAGVGRATAIEFARHGCDVGIIARDQQRLDEAAEELRRLGVRARAVSADVSDFAALDAAATRIEQELGPIDVWVNNAMATIFAPVRSNHARRVSPRDGSDLSGPSAWDHGRADTHALTQLRHYHQCWLCAGVSRNPTAICLLRG